MRAERLLKLADYLENSVEDAWFDLNTWGSVGFADHKCGTVGCAIGFYCTAFPQDGLLLRRDLFYPRYIPEYNGYIDYSAAAACFDIPRNHAVALFSPQYYHENDLPNDRISVFKRIRSYVKKYGDRGVCF